MSEMRYELPYSCIGALAQLLQLLEGAGMFPVVHSGHVLATAQVADADGRVGAVGEGAGVGGPKLGGRRARGVLGVPEDGTGSG